MSAKTAISWTDATWSPVTGCTRVSEGCRHCYIERTPPFRMAHRRFDSPEIGATTGVQLHPERLGIPLHWRKPKMIFVCSMADLFHDDVPDNYIGAVFNTIALAPQHTFQILTKRPARMRSLLTKWATQVPDDLPQYKAAFRAHGAQWAMVKQWPLPNVWLGVSAENQQWADIRIPALLSTPAVVRFVSAEPLLGPIDLYHSHCPEHDFAGGMCTFSCPQRRRPDWVIVGGESGPKARPMHPGWARSLRDQCVNTGVAFHFKQWGEWSPMAPVDTHGRFKFDGSHTMAHDGTLYQPGALTWPDGPRVGEAIRADHGRASLTSMYRVGKKNAGRELDGRTWDEYPQAQEVTT